MRVDDEHFHVAIQRGEIQPDGRFSRFEMSLGTLGGRPKNGYLVGTVNAVPSAKVVYIGHVHYQIAGHDLRIQYQQDLNAARRYIDAQFPSLKGKVEHIEPDYLPVNRNCASSPMMIPIYIPRSR